MGTISLAAPEGTGPKGTRAEDGGGVVRRSRWPGHLHGLEAVEPDSVDR